MKCDFCNNEFSNKQNLNAHQKRAKYCLKLQGVSGVEKNYICDYCKKEFNVSSNYKRHIKRCKVSEINVVFEKKIMSLETKIETLETLIIELRADKKDLQERYDNLATTAVKRPTNSTKNIQINNYIKNMSPLLESDIKENVQYLTLDHHVKGAEGYAEYALEFPFKDKIVCVDTARNKIKYKNEEGDVIEDVGFRKMMEKLCLALKDRSFNLSQEHYEKLAETFTEKEVDDYNFMETAIAISKYANGKENDFCNKIIKMISKGIVVK
uniref:C2H2-type domain-containing protein n=1 Tax=viral metagenome TaxID=1070528 RepID=A0A6C0JTP6_9ZZZZ